MVDAAAGWYNDPERAGQLRWWNGTSWSEHRADAPAIPPSTTSTSQPAAIIPPTIYPPPMPLAFDYPPPTSATAPIAPFPLASPTSEPTRHGRALWIVIGSAAVVVVIVAALAIYAIPRWIDSRATGIPTATTTPTPTLTQESQTPGLDQPGMVGTFNIVHQGGEVSTAGASFTDETTHYASEGMDARCAPLAFGTPVDGNTADSAHYLEYYSNYVSLSGGTSMEGAVQQFESAEQVRDYTAGRQALLTSCLGGFAVSGGLDTVAVDPTTHGSDELLAWTQVVTSTTQSYTVHDIEWRNGPLVARSWCYQLSGTADSADICSQWATEVQAALKLSH